MYQTTVTIGRNIGTEMMRHQDWERFGNSVRAALLPIAEDQRTVEIHNGMGKWVNSDGTTSYEDSMHLTIRHTSPATYSLANLRHILASLALTYGQEAIALATGPVILVTPSKF